MHSEGEEILESKLADDPSIEPIVDTLRTYLGAHPRALDCARGVREWWLADLPGPHDPVAVAAAIERLAAEGLLEPVLLPDGTKMWRSVPSPG